MSAIQLQFDTRVRVVSLRNLEAMCDRASGVCHSFSVVRVSENRVWVEYSNPDEYGNPRPVEVAYPTFRAFPGLTGSCKDNPAVVLQQIGWRGVHRDEDDSVFQSFDQIEGGPALWWNPTNNEWEEVTTDADES